jgi:hypothetical protein
MSIRLAGREGFEPSIPDPKSGALPLGDRPSPDFYSRSPHAELKIGSSTFFESFLRPTFCDHLVIFRNYLLFDHPAGFVVDRMSDILVSSVFAFLAGHRHEIPAGAANDLEISDHKAVIQGNSHVSPELVFVDGKDPNLGNLHRDPLWCQMLLAGSFSWATETILT